MTGEEKKEILKELEALPQRRAACIGALNAVQRHRRWVSDESVRDVAEFLEMTPDEVDNVATFYSLIFRRPVGRKVLKVCDSVVCWMLGAESLLAHLEAKLGIRAGETTPDGEFTLLRICCLGDCDHAPCLMVNNRQVRDVTRDTLDRIIAGEE